MAPAPRTKSEYEYEWALYEFDQYGGKRPHPPTVTEQGLWHAADVRAAAVTGATEPPSPAPAPAPTPAPEPIKEKPVATRTTRARPPRLSSAPPGYTGGGDFRTMYGPSGNLPVSVQGPRGLMATGSNLPPAGTGHSLDVSRPGMVLNRPALAAPGELPMVERVYSSPAPYGSTPEARMGSVLGLGGPASQPFYGQGDLFGGGGTVPQGFVRDPSNVGTGRFALAPAEQGALWSELDPRTQGLKRVLGGGMTSALPTVSPITPPPAAPVATYAPPPHDPRAYSTRPMSADRVAGPVGIGAVGAGNLLLGGVLKGMEMRDALPANVDPNLADLNMAAGAPIGISAQPAFETPVEVQYMRALDADRQARQVGGGRGTAPSYTYPVPHRGNGVAAPEPVAQVFGSSADGTQFGGSLDNGGWVQGGVPAAPHQVQPAAAARPTPARPVARPVHRPAARPGPWEPMQVDPSILVQRPVASTVLPVGNANIDNETRLRAYRALGLTP